MGTIIGKNAGLVIDSLLWNARKSVWISSPYISKHYAERLVSLSRKGIEVKIITSNDEHFIESLQILNAPENSNLKLLIINRQKHGLIHAKIFIIDHTKAFSGSVNLTYNGLNSNYENLSIIERPDEIQKIEYGFMRMWMDFETKSMSEDEFKVEKATQIKSALALLVDHSEFNSSNIHRKKLVYYPYYFFDYSFRASLGRSPPKVFENSGLILVDCLTRTIFQDSVLRDEIKNQTITNYVLRPKNDYKLEIKEAKIYSYNEAKERVIEYIRKHNTKHYYQCYGNRTYDRIFIPYPSIIRFLRSGLVRIPLWYIEKHEPNGKKHEDVFFGASGKKWDEFLICPKCKRKCLIDQTVECQNCGIEICEDCIKRVGIIFKKNLCSSCQPN